MKLADLKRAIALNGGFTLNHKGEFLMADRGFMVSLSGFEKVTTLEAFDERTLKGYLRIARKKRAYFGAWLDNGNLYLDISIKTTNKQLARKMGKKNDQIAIFDLSKNESIYLKH